MSDYRRSLQGRVSRDNGNYFENMILDAARIYEEKGIAVIDKTPEPMKVLKPLDRGKGQFICCFAKQAQPDFKGALMDATMILFDAKHTDSDRISRKIVSEEQERCFERYGKMGAMCFVVASIGFEKYYRIPWVVFRDMKKIYGHQFMTEQELQSYEIKYSRGMLRFLDGLELKDEGGQQDESSKV